MTETIDVFALPVLAAANVFPMMPDDELQELAADIRENGLNDPLVVAEVQTAEGEIIEVLVDGRNRRAACKLAGIEPSVRRLDSDPNTYVLSANIHRRHMTKSQRAMAVAFIYPDSIKYKRGGNSLETKELGLSASLLSQARGVLSHSRPLAESVLAGIKPLDAAYKEAQIAKQAQLGEAARMDRLRSEASDLADLVTEDRMTLSEAIAANDKRQSERAERIQQAQSASSRLWRDISNSLACIAHGTELGWRHALSDEDKGMAEDLVRRLNELLKETSDEA